MASRPFVRALVWGGGTALLIVAAVIGVESLRERPEPPTAAAKQQDPAPPLDVPFVPTRSPIVDQMLEMAAVGPDDYVIDLGSGDGRILIAAARRTGARGLGVDLDPARIRDARYNARDAGVSDKVEFRRQDLFATPIGEASVLTLYLLPEINLRLRPRILREMQPGSRVVSHAYDMGEWRWDRREYVDGANVYLWIVPARVEGQWSLSSPSGKATLDLRQRFNELEGTVAVGGRSEPIERGRVNGQEVRFVADLGGGRRLFEGHAEGDRIVPSDRAPSYPLTPATGWHADRIG